MNVNVLSGILVMVYIQTKLMTCRLSRKYKNLVLFWKIIFSYISMFQWIMPQSTILEDILLVESVIWKILWQNCKRQLKVMRYWLFHYVFWIMGICILNFLLNFYCVISHQNMHIGIQYFLEKILKFDIFCRDHKSWVLFESNPFFGVINKYRKEYRVMTNLMWILFLCVFWQRWPLL